jgi:Kef-type K+ transport system membrane component KefB
VADDVAITVVYEIGLLIVAASLASELFKRAKLPGLIGAILVGVFIGGPGGLGLVTDLAAVNLLALLGSVLIVFMIGLEFEASAFWRVGRRAVLLTTIGVVSAVIVGYTLAVGLGWSSEAALLLGIVLAPSGTSVIAILLSSMGKVETQAGSTLLTAAIVDDVEGVLLLSIGFGLLTRPTFSTGDVLWLGVIATSFILGSVYIGGRLFPRLMPKFEKLLSDETVFAVLLGLGLILAFGATLVGLAAITGAFIMGAIVPYAKIGEKIAHRLFFVKEILAAVFFASIGLSIDPYIVPGLLPLAMLILGVALTARLAGGIVGGTVGGFRGRPLLVLALALAIRAEMSLILARQGVAVGIVGPEFLALAAIVVVGSIVIAVPVLSKLARAL